MGTPRLGVPTLLYAEVKTAPDQPVGVLQASAQFPSLQRGAPTADLGLVSGLGKVRVGQSELAALPRASLGVSASTSGAARGRLHDPGGACMTPEGCASQSACSHAAPRGHPRHCRPRQRRGDGPTDNWRVAAIKGPSQQNSTCQRTRKGVAGSACPGRWARQQWEARTWSGMGSG